jgi:protein-tyrosine phosphatase/membrane-associated phospholipid phosphatase
MIDATHQTSHVRFVRAFAWSLGLSVFFLFVYGASNWIAAQRQLTSHNLPTVCFRWERARAIPFVPQMIWPYISLDALFFVAPLVCCRTRRELHVLGGRILLAISVAGICFVVFPLKMAYVAPVDQLHGLTHFIFASLAAHSTYNLAPSLHIALGSILCIAYVDRFPKLRAIIYGWFVLIAASTLLTYQHHLFDLLCGQALAMICFYAIPEGASGGTRLAHPNWKIALRYAGGAVACVFVGAIIGGWGWIGLSGALSLAILCGAYLGWGSAIFRKNADGKLPASTWFTLAPYLIVAASVRAIYRLKLPAVVRVAPGLYLGRQLTRLEARDIIKSERIAAVLDLTCELQETPPLRGLQYCNLPVLDLTTPTAEQLDAAAAFITECRRRQENVFVHCALGCSRSVDVVLEYLVRQRVVNSADEALLHIRRTRPQALPTRVPVIAYSTVP